jgi:transposase
MTRKIVMSDLRDILTLLAHNGSYRQIQKKVGVSHALIGKIKRRIRELGKPIEELLKLNDLALQAQIYPPRKVTRRLPDWNFVYDKSQKQKVSLLMIYEEIYSKEDGGEDGPPPMAYSTFCQNFEIWKRRTGHFEQVCNLLVAPGEQMQIDFAGDTFKWIEKKTGEIHIGQVFVACLPASKLTFAYVTEKQKRPDWIKGTVAAVEYFGGCPKTLVVDNAKALVSKADRYEAIFPKQIKSLCAYYKMVPDACKPGKPREKNRVEAAVNDVERHVIAKMCLNGIPVYEDLNELNKDVKKHCDEFNWDFSRRERCSQTREQPKFSNTRVIRTTKLF